MEHWQGNMNNSSNVFSPLTILDLARSCSQPVVIHDCLGISRAACVVAAELAICNLLKGPTYQVSEPMVFAFVLYMTCDLFSNKTTVLINFHMFWVWRRGETIIPLGTCCNYFLVIFVHLAHDSTGDSISALETAVLHRNADAVHLCASHRRGVFQAGLLFLCSSTLLLGITFFIVIENACCNFPRNVNVSHSFAVNSRLILNCDV